MTLRIDAIDKGRQARRELRVLEVAGEFLVHAVRG